MSAKRAKPSRLDVVRLPVTSRIARITREALDGDRERGLAKTHRQVDLCRETGLARSQIDRIKAVTTDAPPFHVQEGLPELCRALGRPEYYCLQLTEAQIAVLDSLQRVHDARGDVGRFVVGVDAVADTHVRAAEVHNAVTGIVKPATPPQPAFVTAASSSDHSKFRKK